MGRRSKLTEKQWNEISKRLLAGEKARPLAEEFGISESAIRLRFSDEHGKIKDVANQLVSAETALKSLSISAQIATIDLAAKLRSISENLAGAASYGAMTAHRLTGLANLQLEKIDDANPLESDDALKSIAVLTGLANKSSEIGLNLMRVNKEAVEQVNRSVIPEEEKQALSVCLYIPDNGRANGD